jgi:hypothetical protein
MNQRIANSASRPRLTFDEIAKLIAPENTPLWLSGHLEWLAQAVRHDRLFDDFKPTKAETLRRLNAIQEAASLLRREINDPVIRNLLEEARRSTRFAISGWALSDLEDRASIAAASPLLTTSPGKAKRGRGKSKVPNVFDAKTLCAARILDLWEYFRGGKPGLSNRRCSEATQAYWLACGGASDGFGDPLNGWYDYFRIVRDNEQAASLIKLRRIWLRDLEQAQRRGRPPRFLGTNFAA